MRRIGYFFTIFFVILSLFAGLILFSPALTRLALRNFLHSYGLTITQVKSFKGNILQGVDAKGLVLRGNIGSFGLSKIMIDQLVIKIKLPFSIAVAINNGQLIQHVSEPILFYGRATKNNIDITIYSRYITLSKLFGTFFHNVDFVQKLHGRAENISVNLTGSLKKPVIDGNFLITELSYRDFAATQVPVDFNFSFYSSASIANLYGGLIFNGGQISNKSSAKIAIREKSKLYFTGQANRPIYDFKGRAKVENVLIDISLTGAKDKPRLTVVSEPVLPKAQIFALILTNRTWGSLNTSLSGEGVSSKLAIDIVDYFIFSGSGQKLFKDIGIDFALNISDKSREVTVKKSIGNKLEAGYTSVTSRSPNGTTAPTKRGAEGIYKITDNLSLEAARVYSASSNDASGYKKEDNIFLKFLKEF